MSCDSSSIRHSANLQTDSVNIYLNRETTLLLDFPFRATLLLLNTDQVALRSTAESPHSRSTEGRLAAPSHRPNFSFGAC
jgi:hypothetical protein